ncbi:hypothetical protein ACFUOZ_06250 [Paenarthrobacter sp. NPDC057355]|uniref:hypothetical protein n=1 Tax=Paenarthrobacter sp. NPDC057355 TaxID=3346105 RepID=UPI00363B6627
MALSATAADASTGTDKNLVDSVTSSSSISVPVPNVPLPASVKGLLPADQVNVPVPAVTPVVKHVGGALDNAVGAVPVANQILPANTAGTIVNTVVAPVIDPVDQAVNVVVPPVNSVVEPVRLEPVTDAVNPVVEPIVGVVDTVLPPLDSVVPPVTVPPVVVPPVTVPDAGLPSAPGADASVAPASPDAGTEPATGVVTSSEPADSSPTVEAEQSTGVGLAVDASWLAHTRNFGPTGITAVLGGSSSAADPAAPSGLPGDFDAVPSGLAGSGSGASSNGPPNPAAAFLHDALIIPADALPGLAAGSDEQHPTPVSFDPGSSPD